MRTLYADSHETETTLLYVYLVEGVEAHGESRHVVSLDSHGWACARDPHCAAVDIARRAHDA